MFVTGCSYLSIGLRTAGVTDATSISLFLVDVDPEEHARALRVCLVLPLQLQVASFPMPMHIDREKWENGFMFRLLCLD